MPESMRLCLKSKYVSDQPAVRLDYCKQLGFTATQESAKSIPGAVARGWPTAAELREHRKPFDDAGIALIALEPLKEPLRSWVDETPAGRESFEIFARHLDAAGEAGIPCVTLHPPLDGATTPQEAQEQFQRNCDFYDRAAKRARQAGTKLATHSPYGTAQGAQGEKRLTKPLWGAREFDALFEAVPDPENGMIYCFGCMVMAGDDAVDLMGRFVDRTFFVHVRDVTMYPDGSFDEVWPGKGNVGPEAAIRRLWDLGYRGPITPEHNPVVFGESYAGPVSTAYSAGWCEAILKELRGS
jgi:sugar phosphate isomerase/epimerase